MFQFAAVKVTDGVETFPSVSFDDDIPITTLAVGWLLRAMVKVACPPSSVVLPEIGDTITPALSSSIN